MADPGAPVGSADQAIDRADDHVVLVDDDGRRLRTWPRSTVHTEATPLHLAFSCYVLDDAGRLLMTRRALSKRTWPGVWTNSCCGHPRWEESVEEALHRHTRHELGLRVVDVELALPDFRYRAVDASGVVEHEICPVYVARAAGAVEANPEEVAELAWARPDDVTAAVAAAPWAFSPWMVEQLGAFAAAGRAFAPMV